MEFAQQVFDVSTEIEEEAQKEHEAVELKYWQKKLERIQELYDEYLGDISKYSSIVNYG